ncbi:MAG: heme-binding domain-containing protein [Chlorobi bacterium]|nr:heme-binding domain-containing protein [Chlorobiota bacterium]
MKIIFWILIAIFLIIQFIPSGRPEVKKDNPKDLLANNIVPDEIANMLKTSCYDCHSNETVYPWYAYVAPVSWLVSRDIRKGHEKLNFSEWENLNKIKKAEHLDSMSDELESEEMPLPIYLLMHSNAKLTPEQRQTLIDWTGDFADSLFE